jgi:ADP-heptose:LPS heptosyltransferase
MKNNRILLIYSGWLGDLVWIVPVLHALKTAYASVSLVVSKTQAPLAGVLTNGLVDELYIDRSAHRLATARAVRCDSRAKGIDTFVDLKGRWKTGIYMPWGRGLRLWIPHPRDAREYVLSRLVHPRAATLPARPDGHMVEAYLSGLGALGVGPSPINFHLPFDAATIAEGERIADREGLRAGPSVALNIGSAQFSKIWPADHYRRLAGVLKNDLGCKVVIMGARSFDPNGNYDLNTARAVFGDGAFTNLVEETSLPVDAYLLHSGAFSVSVGNDSFANHMAGSASEVPAGTPGAVQAANGRWYKANRTVSLFGPTNPVYCRPYDPTGTFNTAVLPESYPDSCVYDRKAHTCPHYGDRYCCDRAHCMQHISVDQVAQAVKNALRANG